MKCTRNIFLCVLLLIIFLLILFIHRFMAHSFTLSNVLLILWLFQCVKSIVKNPRNNTKAKLLLIGYLWWGRNFGTNLDFNKLIIFLWKKNYFFSIAILSLICLKLKLWIFIIFFTFFSLIPYKYIYKSMLWNKLLYFIS